MTAPTDRLELRALVDTYATAADARDDDLFVSLFAPGALLRLRQNGELLGVFAAPDGLRDATATLDRYRATMYLVANQTCTVDGDAATGTTYCFANHVAPVGDGFENLQMVIRYDDAYVRDADGAWRFSLRDLNILWTEAHPVSLEPPRL